MLLAIVGLLELVVVVVHLVDHANHPVWVVTIVGPELVDSNPVVVSVVAGPAIVVETHHTRFAISMVVANSVPVFLDRAQIVRSIADFLSMVGKIYPHISRFPSPSRRSAFGLEVTST